LQTVHFRQIGYPFFYREPVKKVCIGVGPDQSTNRLTGSRQFLDYVTAKQTRGASDKVHTSLSLDITLPAAAQWVPSLAILCSNIWVRILLIPAL